LIDLANYNLEPPFKAIFCHQLSLNRYLGFFAILHQRNADTIYFQSSCMEAPNQEQM